MSLKTWKHDRARVTVRATDCLCAVLGRVHRGVGAGLTHAARLVGGVLAPVPWSGRFGLMAAVMAVLTAAISVWGWDWALQRADVGEAQRALLGQEGFEAAFEVLARLALCTAALLAAGALLAFVRHRLVALLLKIGGAAYAVVWLFALGMAVRVPAFLHGVDPVEFSEHLRNDLWVAGAWCWVPVALLGTTFLVSLMRRDANAFYGARRAGARPLWGDHLVRELATGGADPRFRTSTYWAVFLHLAPLFAPMLIRGCRMMEAYEIPGGGGNPIARIVRIKKIKRKEGKKYVLNMNSPIIFWVPKIDDSNILQEVDEDTLDEYAPTALTTETTSGIKGLWPGGMSDAEVRFIRLKYRGGDWDQDMGKKADYNMLLQFHKLTGLKITPRTESIPIGALRRFPKHRGPPFVFITGGGNISLSSEEVRTLRWYCLEDGGMIFADNGGGSFNHHFRLAMRRVFPDLAWIDIASDDILYRQPYIFPNGAPPLWHHSGNRALGLKYKGRWICFYHQGDINDAWKTGHSGATVNQAMQAYKLAVNVINYAFHRYVAWHAKQ